MSPVFLDIVAVFALFRRSVLNLLIIVTLLYTTVLSLFYRAHPHYHFLVTIARILFSYSLVKDRRLVTVGFCIW